MTSHPRLSWLPANHYTGSKLRHNRHRLEDTSPGLQERSGSDGLGIKDRWRYVNDVGSGRFDPFVQTPHAHLEGLEARFMIRVVNTAIHSVTGEHNLRLDGFEMRSRRSCRSGRGKAPPA